MKKITDFKAGETARLHHKITPADIQSFVDLTGDDNPLHTDAAWAESSSMRGIVSHGMLSASFISTIIGKKLPGPGALWLSQSIECLLPVRVNDTLTVEATVVEVHTRQRSLDLACSITNQDGKEVLRGTCAVKLLDEPEAEKTSPRTASRGIIVTGASRGIGAAIAKALGAAGFVVIVNYRSSEDAAKQVCAVIIEAGGKAWPVHADITKPKQVAAMVEQAALHCDEIYGLVNNAAGKVIEHAFKDLAWADIVEEYTAQVGSAYECIKHVVPHMQAHGGVIVNIGSIVADQSPPPAWLPYNLAKAGLHALTRNLAEVLGGSGIRVNTVAPGLTDSGMALDFPERARLMTKMQTPLRRLADPDDIAGAVAYLMSDAAHCVSGETIRVNGGKTTL